MSKTAREVIHEWGLDEEAFERTDALIARLDAAGFVIVPKIPTPEMLKAGGDKHDGNDFMSPEDFEKQAADIYRAMIAKAITQ